tara:strand:+ start:21895 stop:23232 length:1338 start_codon:yes stop_codon:yes gene_type:complete
MAVLPKHKAQLNAARKMATSHAEALASYEAPRGLQSLLPTADARAAFEKAGFPTPVNEAWTFTNLAPLAKTNFTLPHKGQVSGAVIGEAKLVRDAVTLVFINGQLSYDLSEMTSLPVGVTIAPLSQAASMLTDSQVAKLKGKTTDGLAAANTAFLTDGYVLRVDEGQNITTPVELVFLSTGGKQAINLKTFITVGKGSTLELSEVYHSTSEEAYWHNSVTYIDVAQNGQLHFTRKQDEGTEAFHTAEVHTTLQRDASFYGFVANLGSKIARTMFETNVAGHNASANLAGFSLTGKGQHHNTSTHTLHGVEHTNANQIFRNVVAEGGHSVFMGKYHVLAEAQHTDAAMLNQNLLLAPSAKADSKPELEIYADDVKCSHGATTGKLDETALFYLQARGIDKSTAMAMLTEGFIDDLLNALPNSQARERLHDAIHRWLGRSMSTSMKG